MLLRGAVRGFIVGGFLTLAAVIVLPHFYGRAFELALLPFTFAVLGAIVHVPALVWRALRKRPPSASRSVATGTWLALAAALILPVALFAIRAPARNWRVAPRLMVLCIDGGTWKVIDPLLAAGRMPTMAGLRRGGVSGVLMSTDPAFTPIVWTTIATGVEPETHGITGFLSTRDQLRHKRIWELFEEGGHSVGMFRWPVTWPPHPTKGFIIPDVLAEDETCFPPEYDFVNRLRMDRKQGRPAGRVGMIAVTWRFLRCGLRMETCMDAAVELIPASRSRRYADFHIAARRAEIRMNADIYCHLLRETEPDFTCFYDNGADVLSHFYWQYYEPELFPKVDPADVERYGSAIPDYYALNDRILGDIISHLDPSTPIVLLSDHGSAADRGGAEALFFPRAGPILEALGLGADYYGIALGSSTFLESLEQDPARNKAALSRVVDVLNAITLDGAGTRVFDATLDGENRVVLGVSPEFTGLDGVVVTETGPYPVRDWFVTSTFSGAHEPDGIYAFGGPPFRAGAEGPQLNLVDIAPTLLHLSGMALSRELVGEVAWDVFSDEFRAARTVSRVDSYGQLEAPRQDPAIDPETLEKLRSLGYVR